MNKNKIRKGLIVLSIIGGVVVGGLVLFAFSRTWGKAEIEFKIHINKELVLQSVYGESPTFAIWLENQTNNETKTAFVTGRAGLEDWEGKVEVPTALPKWSEINQLEKNNSEDTEIDAVSGATPQPGYFVTRTGAKPGDHYVCWIEMNLSGDYNEYYAEFDTVSHARDEFGTGQPALLFRAEFDANVGTVVNPEIIGMCLLNSEGSVAVKKPKGITTAKNVFDEINITVVKPKPRILSK